MFVSEATYCRCRISLTSLAVGVTAGASRVVQQPAWAATRRQASGLLHCRWGGVHCPCTVLLTRQVEVGSADDAAVLSEAVLVAGLQPTGAGSALEAGNVKDEIARANDEFGGGNRLAALLASWSKEAGKE